MITVVFGCHDENLITFYRVSRLVTTFGVTIPVVFGCHDENLIGFYGCHGSRQHLELRFLWFLGVTMKISLRFMGVTASHTNLEL